MKSKFIYIIAASVCGFMLTGCYDLDRAPANQLSSLTFYKNQTHADEAMMGVYSVMRNENCMGVNYRFDVLGGLCDGAVQKVTTVQVGTYDASSAFLISYWQTTYEGIARANMVLQNINNTNMTESLKAQYRGEARFMRGLYYFFLYKLWGGVPIYDESFNVENYEQMNYPRSSGEQTIDFILADMDSAIAVLPEAWDAANLGRATKYAALALKGKVLLYRKRYQEASECFQKVIDSGRYELYPNYADLFQPEADNCNEMIFSIQTTSGATSNVGLPSCLYLGTRSTWGWDWNQDYPSVELVDSYEYKNGRPFDWDDFIPNFSESNNVKKATFRATFEGNKESKYPAAKDKLLAMYKQRDPRMSASVILPYTHYLGYADNHEIDCEYAIAGSSIKGANWGYIQVDRGLEVYLWRKFVPVGDMGGQMFDRKQTPINFPLIRYADVLLMQAECLNELGDQPDAISLINQVRARAGVALINNGSPWTRATTHDEVFQRIVHERAVELACEGHSYFDLKRWGMLDTLNDRRVCDITGTYRWTRKVTDRDYLWPIPSSEVEKNPNLEQNPGW